MGIHGAVGARAREGTSARRAAHSADDRIAGRSRTLGNWPVSSRLFAVIVMALVMGLVFGGLRIADAEGSAAQFGRVSRLASLGEQVTTLIHDLQDERDATVGLLAGGSTDVLKPLFSKTNAAVARVRPLATAIGGSFPVNIQTDAATVLTDLSPGRIAELHDTLNSSQDVFAVIANYAVPISDLITLNDQITQGVSDSALANDVRTLNSLSLAKEQASQQRALLYSLLFDSFFVSGNLTTTDSSEFSALNVAYSQELVDEAAFQATATPTEKTAFTNALGAKGAGAAEEIEDYVFANAGPGTPLTDAGVETLGFNLTRAPHAWFTAMSAKVNALQSVAGQIAGNIAARAQSLQQGAQQTALITIVITAVVLFLVLIAALLVARSLVLPLRRLRAGALDIATVQLPERVRQLSEAPDSAANLTVAPIDVLTSDEIGQVARAFDQVHAEAVRLAGNEALLRTSFNAMFVNLSRRSQSLIERLARMIESLEQNEDDPDRLSGLFSMDHLVTRMRRNSENLLLLAGHEGARKWSEPVSLADVARAATSEIEQYSRVVLSIQPGVAVIGQAVSDVVHLLAELVENATLFSPKDTQVSVTGQELSSGGVLIEITDEGIGVSETRLAEINWRLDNPPVIDVSVSRHMGLFAVARLAERHRIRVRLRPANPQGLSALVWLPETVIERTARGYPAPAVGYSKPFSAEPTPLASRASGQRNIGMRSAIEGRRAGVAEAAVPAGVDPSGDEQVSQRMSSWFRSQRISATGVGSGNAARPSGGGNADTGGWQSMGGNGPDPWAQGRHAAEIIADPIRGEQTSAGLPLRVPKANLIPGAAGAPGPSGPGGAEWPDGYNGLSQRSPELARSRLSGFQRGARRAESGRPNAGEGTSS